MDEAQIVSLIGSLGFPIAMCLWFMLKGSKIIEKNTDALLALKDMIETTHPSRKK